MCKHDKPSAYNLVKEDYGLYDENMFDDKLLNLSGNDDVFNSYHVAKSVEIGEDFAEKNVKEGKLLNDINNLLNTKFEGLKGELKNFTDDSKNVLEFQSLFRCIVCYSTTPVTPLVYSVDGTWDAITAFVVWIVPQSSAKVLNVVVVKNFHATRCLFLV